MYWLIPVQDSVSMHNDKTEFPLVTFLSCPDDSLTTRREFLREILYRNIAVIAIQHSKIYFFDTLGDFSHTFE